MAENVNLTFDLKYLENGASDENSMSSIFVQLVERNPTVFIPGRYDQ